MQKQQNKIYISLTQSIMWCEIDQKNWSLNCFFCNFNKKRYEENCLWQFFLFLFCGFYISLSFSLFLLSFEREKRESLGSREKAKEVFDSREKVFFFEGKNMRKKFFSWNFLTKISKWNNFFSVLACFVGDMVHNSFFIFIHLFE